MTNRREFLQIGVAATAWPMTAKTNTMAQNINTETNLPFYKAVFDSRYQDSLRFAEQMRSQDIAVHGIKGDITEFWYQELDAVWKQGPVAVAGMTAHGPLFCLEQLALGLGMKVVYRTEHRQMPDNIIQHQLSAPEIMLDKSKAGPLALASLDTDWAAGVAKLMQVCPAGHTAIEQANLMMPLSTLSQSSAEVNIVTDPLISWIIAPAQKA